MSLILVENHLIGNKIVSFLNLHETISYMRSSRDHFQAIINVQPRRTLMFNLKDCRSKVNVLKVYNLHENEVLISTFLSFPLRRRSDENKISKLKIEKYMRSEVNSLKELRNVKNLDLIFAKLTIDTLKAVSALKNLRVLSIRSNNTLSPTGLQQILSNLTNLIDLDISDCRRITDASLKHFTGQHNLKALYLANTKITDKGLVHLSLLLNLSKLDLSDTNITDNGLVFVSNLVNLRDLYLNGCKYISGTGLSNFSNDCKLSNLSINPNVTDTGLDTIAKLSNLTQLYLRPNCQITEDAVERNFVYLKKLYVFHFNNGTRLSDRLLFLYRSYLYECIM